MNKPTINDCIELNNRMLLVGQAVRCGMERAEAEKMPNDWLLGYVMGEQLIREERIINWMKGEAI